MEGHFWQNGQELHDNYKIIILGAKQWGVTVGRLISFTW